jgi:ketosteroid isomerase-like protein
MSNDPKSQLPESQTLEPQSLEARVRRLEDLEEIRRLFIDFGKHLDAGDFAAYAALFSEKGEVILGPLGSAIGRAAIQALLERALGRGSRGTHHIIANPLIELDGDRATTDVAWVFFAKHADGRPAVAMLGRHRDLVIRERGVWRFARREGFIDIPSSWPMSAPSSQAT